MKTVESVAENFKTLKKFSYNIYVGNVNQFLSIIGGNDSEGIRDQFYPGWPIENFRRVLEILGEI